MDSSTATEARTPVPAERAAPTALPYHLDPSPGAGALPARAHLASDRPEASLAGRWGFCFAPSVAAAHADPAGDGAEFPDTTAVPGHWVLDESNGPLVTGRTNRFGSPWYTNVVYPFPVDPPFVPDANGTGDHLREFTLAGLGFDDDARRVMDRVLLRFEGVESVFKVWLNGTELGHAAGSRLTHEFDATAALRADGPNRLVVRVHQFSAASYLEDQDQWWLPGIFRDVRLVGQPRRGITDARVVADYDDGAGTLTLEADAPADAHPLVLRIPELGIEHTLDVPDAGGPARAVVPVGAVQGWTAETPRLYAAELSAPGETVSLRLGFRRVAIEDGVLTVNGRPVRLKGVNRHEFDPRAGRAVTEEFTRNELLLMKRNNINAIRTSHYPPNHHLLDLADELGFWLIDECDLETHGFVVQDWARNPSDDPAWRDAYLDRIERTWRRDSNHASVVLWSLGNESGTGANLAAMADWVREHDPMRPVHYEGDHDAAYTDVYSRMYATPPESASILRAEAVPSASAAGSARIAGQPYVLCEYVHAMGNGPGGISDYEALFDENPRAAGGFVWEWKDHGILARTPEGEPVHAYGGDFAEPIHDGNFVLDGLVFADGTPGPGLAEYAKVIEPVRLSPDAAAGTVAIANRQDFADTAALAFGWTVHNADGLAVASGEMGVEAVPPRHSASASLPAEALRALNANAGATVTIEAMLARATPWANAGHVLAWGQDVGAVRSVGSVSEAEALPGVGAARDERVHAPSGELPDGAVFGPDGLLRSLDGVGLTGPELGAYRAPTDNDTGTIEPTRDMRHVPATDPSVPEDFDWDAYAGTEPGPVVAIAQRWKDAGLHLLQRRTVSLERERGAVRAEYRYAPPALPTGFRVQQAWTAAPAGALGAPAALRLRARAAALQDYGFPLARLGFDFALSRDALADTPDTVRWLGLGPGEGYSDSAKAQRFGRHTAAPDDLHTDYPMPQANGRRAGLRRLELGLCDGRVLRIDVVSGPEDTGFTLSPWSQNELDAARHPCELPEPSAWHLGIDAGQHGLGSRSCGVDVPAADAFLATEAELVLDISVVDGSPGIEVPVNDAVPVADAGAAPGNHFPRLETP
jgi:beta-galactosidase